MLSPSKTAFFLGLKVQWRTWRDCPANIRYSNCQFLPLQDELTIYAVIMSWSLKVCSTKWLRHGDLLWTDGIHWAQILWVSQTKPKIWDSSQNTTLLCCSESGRRCHWTTHWVRWTNQYHLQRNLILLYPPKQMAPVVDLLWRYVVILCTFRHWLTIEHVY